MRVRSPLVFWSSYAKYYTKEALEWPFIKTRRLTKKVIAPISKATGKPGRIAASPFKAALKSTVKLSKLAAKFGSGVLTVLTIIPLVKQTYRLVKKVALIAGAY